MAKIPLKRGIKGILSDRLECVLPTGRVDHNSRNVLLNPKVGMWASFYYTVYAIG